MPELPDLTVYCEAIGRLVGGRRLEGVRLVSPFLLRSVEPPLAAAAGRTLVGCSLVGKRIALELSGELFLVVHLMIAGRLHWVAEGMKPRGRSGKLSAALDFEHGALTLTEAGTRKRASLHVVGSRAALEAMDPGGIDVLHCEQDAFREALTRENHTLKRALTDPKLLAGIGNAYSDEILHAAGLSPVKRTQSLTDGEIDALLRACREVLTAWTDRLRAEAGAAFPERVTAFHPEMAVHGRYRQPCPRCGQAVQRIVYARNEANYCARCQTGGKLLADRALSRLLHGDWPRTPEELEERLGHDKSTPRR
jgi:formamidopyrimidine-DNA glycosylase